MKQSGYFIKLGVCILCLAVFNQTYASIERPSNDSWLFSSCKRLKQCFDKPDDNTFDMQLEKAHHMRVMVPGGFISTLLKEETQPAQSWSPIFLDPRAEVVHLIINYMRENHLSIEYVLNVRMGQLRGFMSLSKAHYRMVTGFEPKISTVIEDMKTNRYFNCLLLKRSPLEVDFLPKSQLLWALMHYTRYPCRSLNVSSLDEISQVKKIDWGFESGSSDGCIHIYGEWSFKKFKCLGERGFGLKENAQFVRELWAFSCKFDDRFVPLVVELMKYTSIEHIDLCDNKITIKGLYELLDGIVMLDQPFLLNLAGNHLGLDGRKRYPRKPKSQKTYQDKFAKAVFPKLAHKQVLLMYDNGRNPLQWIVIATHVFLNGRMRFLNNKQFPRESCSDVVERVKLEYFKDNPLEVVLIYS